ncbi:hypothetical protein HanIR_Chr09g0432371 [Helianthus annuus]|nr:hypothetical protein HanIR_Chr09g0432371 [Helianthus annuus]
MWHQPSQLSSFFSHKANGVCPRFHANPSGAARDFIQTQVAMVQDVKGCSWTTSAVPICTY